MFFDEFFGRMTASVNETGVLININVPGHGKEDLSLKANNGVLTVSKKNPEPVRKATSFTIGNNRKFRYVYRTNSLDNGINIPVSEEFDLTRVSASVDKGILVINVPYREKNTSGDIEIQIA